MKREEKGADCITREEYLEYLIHTYQNLIFSICLKSVSNPFDAEDLTQDVFLSAYKNLSRFDGNYEKAWLSKIAVRKCLDHLKAAGRRTIPTEDTYFKQLHDKEFSPEEAFLDKDFKDRIRHLCSALKSPYREVALEHFCEEKTAAEIAKAQNKNIKTVQTQIYRSRSMLKALLERSD